MKKLSKLFALVLSAALIFSFTSCQESSDSGKPAASEPFYNAFTSLKAVEGVSNVYTVEFDGEDYLDGAITAELKTAKELEERIEKLETLDVPASTPESFSIPEPRIIKFNIPKI